MSDFSTGFGSDPVGGGATPSSTSAFLRSSPFRSPLSSVVGGAGGSGAGSAVQAAAAGGGGAKSAQGSPSSNVAASAVSYLERAGRARTKLKVGKNYVVIEW